MLKLITFGEALIDMLSNRIDTGDTSEHETFTKFPGGAPANVAAAVAKLGGNSYMAGKIGEDDFGDFVRQSLVDAKVNDLYLLSTDEAKTALAFVSLDSLGERSFSFCRDPSADMLFRANEFADSWFDETGLFHFCSNTLTADAIFQATMAGIAKAKAAACCVSFDINLRTNLWPEDRDPLAFIWQCIHQSNILKLSVEEMQFLCHERSEKDVLGEIFSSTVELLLLTDGAKPLRYFVKKVGANSEGSRGALAGKGSLYTEGSITPPKIKMVDSTAAGDAFIGGFLYQLATQQITQAELVHFSNHEPSLRHALSFASRCGAYAASHQGAFTSLPTLNDIHI